MSLFSLPDEPILRYHPNLRLMVALDIGADGRTLLGEEARKRGRDLEDELRRRGIEFEPIAWPA